MAPLNNKSTLLPELQQLYHSLFLGNTPFIDLRAPLEFNQGAFPSSINLPLMTDNERAQVGTCYKRKGQDAAIVLGHQLVDADINNRIAGWIAFKAANPSAWLYCFRGGLRSRLSVKSLKDNGVDINMIPGGYKALRRFLLEVIEQNAAKPLTIVAGNTGSGKTILIQELANGLDIEGRANHRGSSFGKQVTAQPRQINYENQLAVDILKISEHSQTLVIEDESKAIGSLYVPLPLFTSMEKAAIVIVNEPLEAREQRLCYEYSTLMKEQYCSTFGEELGWEAYEAHVHRGLFGIRKRLGLEKYKALTLVLDEALRQQKSTGSNEGHLNWVAPILRDYYDPMYQYQLEKKSSRTKFIGTYQEVKEWLITNAN